MHVEEAEAQPLQLGIDAVAQVGDDLALRQAGGGHVVVVGQHRPQQRLGDNRHRHQGDDLQRRPSHRRRPAKRINRGSLRRVERMADDINHQPEQLQAHQPEQQQHQALRQRPQAIAAELPRQSHQSSHEFAGGIPALAGSVRRRCGHTQPDKMPPAAPSIQRKAAAVRLQSAVPQSCKLPAASKCERG